MQFLYLIFMLWVDLSVGNSDSDALLEFMRGIKEDPSGHIFGSWSANSLDTDGCPNNWFGIQCIDGHVETLVLNDLSLVGSIDFSALGGLKMLHNLSVSNNQLTGILSAEIGSIGSLEVLDLSCNSFHGPIPDELMNLENLVSLNLSLNNFSGMVPSDFGNLQSLESLDLHSNGFSGDIRSLLAQLRNPIHVDLSCNAFTGSLDLGLGNSTFVHSVEYLNISHNALVGEIFTDDEIPLFDNLEVFDASYNQLIGQISSFNFLVSLRILRLGNNQFSGSLPEALLQESSTVLSDLDLSNNQLQGPIGSITSATLRYLNISSNNVSGFLPSKVGHCAIVDLSNNRLSGSISNIQGWGNYVEVIHLSSNSLTGSLPNDTSQFLRLTSLKISNNSLYGPLPLVIGTYPDLTVIDLSLNQLNGSLLPSLFTSVRLTYLNLSGNSFTGPIPFPSAQVAISTTLDDPLPSAQNLSLLSLDLSDNMLNGSLLPVIGTMDQLKLLNIAKNNISGQIPRELSKLYSLAFLDLSNNNFEGRIPDNLPDGLEHFNVSFNNLSGIVPENLRRFPDSSFHPGNALLIVPQSPVSPRNGPGVTWKEKQRNHMKFAIKAALVIGFVGVTTLVIILFTLIYYRNIRGKDASQGRSQLPHFLGKPTLSSHTYLSFSQDQLLSSAPRSVSEHGDVSSKRKGPAGQGFVQSNMKDHSPPKTIGKSSPFYVLSSPSQDLEPSEHPAVLQVCSPDRLAGDLHLFENSFVFTAEELSRAPAEVIGRSCHGTSYKATLDCGHALTVKWLREGIAKGKKEFSREAKKLGNIRHPNIVSLRGYYWGPKEHERLIVSDYIEGTCLASHLYETEATKFLPLSLTQRHKISIDVARCLNYLHNERAIPHGNLKSTNVILEAHDMNALLGDYSLHRIMNSAGTAEQVLNAGALGYRPPEFANMSKPCPSLKSDVYAFGVILLEIITGRSAGEIVSGNPGVVDLTDWVRTLASENRAIDCFDKQIPGVNGIDGPPNGLEELLHVALKCILPASERPDIRTIFEDLSSIQL